MAVALRPPLLRLCASYLTTVRNGKGPLDPVARFHLGNGARLERINWLGNPGERGLQESYGIMVNYLYDIATIEADHEAFVRDDIIARSEDIYAAARAMRLLQPPSFRAFALKLLLCLKARSSTGRPVRRSGRGGTPARRR